MPNGLKAYRSKATVICDGSQTGQMRNENKHRSVL
jgi:hypothetical protein